MISGQSNKADVHRYIRDVLSGEIVAGKMLKHACQRHLDDIENADKLGIYFNEVEASAAIDWFTKLIHCDGEYAGRPFILYDWQKFIVWYVMGWRRKEDGFRRIREVLIQVARGNGKTAFAAAWLLMLFCCDFPEPENLAQCYTTATKRDQAALSFSTAKRFALQPFFEGEVDPQRFKIIAKDGGTLEALSCDGKGADGLQIHGLIKDELHAWRKIHEEFAEKLDTAMAKRVQPLAITITTAGNEDSEMWIKADKRSRAVLTGILEAEYHAAFIYEVDEEDDPLDPAVWDKANPMLKHGVVKRRVLEGLAEEAKNDNSALMTFTRYYANRLVTSDETIIDPKQWAACTREVPDLSGRACFGGFDLGLVDDLTAMAWVFPFHDAGQPRDYFVLLDCWVPRGGRHNLLQDPWRKWIETGQLTVTDSECTDTQAVVERVKQRQDQFSVRSIAFDKNNAWDLGNVFLNDLGIEIYPFPQTCSKYNNPLNELKAAVKEKRLGHDGGSLLAWAAVNMIPHEDSRGYEMPAKRKARAKIDPIVATLMAISEMMYHEPKKRSVYEDRGVLFAEA